MQLIAFIFIFITTLFFPWFVALPLFVLYALWFRGFELFIIAFVADAVFGAGAVFPYIYIVGTALLLTVTTLGKPYLRMYRDV